MNVFGIHSVKSILEKHPERVFHLYIQKTQDKTPDKKFKDILTLAQKHNIKVSHLSKPELDRMTENAVHQGILAQCEKSKVHNESDLSNLLENTPNPFLLILDGVQDPHNLGACLRTADAAGVTAVIVPKDKSVAITPTVSKVASGAAEVVPFIQVTNLARTMEELKERNIWLYGAAGEAQESLYQTKFSKSCGIVLGAEGEGLRRLTKETCDVLVKIPMFGSVSSLNVSVATGVFLFEVVRQIK